LPLGDLRATALDETCIVAPSGQSKPGNVSTYADDPLAGRSEMMPARSETSARH